MADFPGVTGRTYTPISLTMRIETDTLRLRSVSPGGREIAQEQVFELGNPVPVALATGFEKAREISVTIDPISFKSWSQAQTTISLQRPTITLILTATGLPSVTVDYEQCGYMGEEMPELVAGEATEFNIPTRWMPTRTRINGKLASSEATV